MSILQAAILGIVQGLAEFLPISSSGHLILTRALMHLSEADAASGAYLMLDVLLHVGTLLAVLVVFWRDWWSILKNPFRSRLLLLLIVASLPAVVAVLLLHDYIDTIFTGWFLGVSFLMTALFLLIADTVICRYQQHAVKKVGFKHAIVMGLLQAVALLPGVSRSGSTLMGGLISGLDRKAAAKFSFMMSAPVILGSMLYEGYGAFKDGSIHALAPIPTLIAVLCSAVMGFLAIRWMLKLITRIPLSYFALYVALLGVAVLVFQLTGLHAVIGLPAFVLPTV